MNRRDSVAMAPAFTVAAASASLVLRAEGQEPIEVGVSVLKLEQGDTLVLQCDGLISVDTAERIKAHVQEIFPFAKALVLSGEMKLEGVLRGPA